MDDISNLFCLSVNESSDKLIKKNNNDFDLYTFRDETHHDQVSFSVLLFTYKIKKNKTKFSSFIKL